MKPNYEVEFVKRLSRYDDPDGRGSFPPIALEFQAPRDGGFNYGGGRPDRPRGFTQLLAREVFRRGSRRRFGVEAVILGSITLATAWQIADMLREVFIVLKNGGIY